MKLIVGLGNPGPKYELTRHNAGFLVLDLLSDKAGAALSEDKKFFGFVGKGQLYGESCVFLKPTTFMNVSGKSVGAVMRFFRVEQQNVVVIHDDIDVPAGKVKARVGGGHGGNNGIRSIIAETGLSDFHRIKIGIGKPGPEDPMDVSSWVLGRFSEGELSTLESEMLRDVEVRLQGIFKDAGGGK